MQWEVRYNASYSMISASHGVIFEFSNVCTGFQCQGKWEIAFQWNKVSNLTWELGWLSSIFDNRFPWHWRFSGQPTHDPSVPSYGVTVPSIQIILQRPVQKNTRHHNKCYDAVCELEVTLL